MDVRCPWCVGLMFEARVRFPEGNDSENKIKEESDHL